VRGIRGGAGCLLVPIDSAIAIMYPGTAPQTRCMWDIEAVRLARCNDEGSLTLLVHELLGPSAHLVQDLEMGVAFDDRDRRATKHVNEAVGNNTEVAAVAFHACCP